MSNWIDYTVDVLASNPTEINQIAERLKHPSPELATWVAKRNCVVSAVMEKLSRADRESPASTPTDIDGLIKQWEEETAKEFATARSSESASEITAALRELVEFKAVRNLGYIADSVNKARRFSNSFKNRYIGIVDSHLQEVSEAFPSAIFLLHYFDMVASYSGKKVIREGEVVRCTYDGDQQAQAQDWALLDIFAPFWAEYELGLQFGSLWHRWVEDVIEAAKSLREPKK